MGGGVINNWVENWFCLEGVLVWRQVGVSRCYVAKLVLIMSSLLPAPPYFITITYVNSMCFDMCTLLHGGGAHIVLCAICVLCL